MDKKAKEALQVQLKGMVEQIASLFEQAMVLRVDVHLTLAFDAGAEAEDIPDIVAGAIESALPITQTFFDSLAEVKRLSAFKKTKDGTT